MPTLFYFLALGLCGLALAQLSSDEYANVENCGRRQVRRPKIINGATASRGQHPWIISLRLNGRHHCGGSLIRPNWILTAAHCVYRVNVNRFQVKLGGYLRSPHTEATSILLNPVMAIAHSGFSYATFADDVALIKLPSRVQYTTHIQPICLPKSPFEQIREDKATVIGWGKLRQGGISAEMLQEADIPIVDNAKCIQWYREKGKMLPIRPTQICAGKEEGGMDACQGDSGSPMLLTDSVTQQSTVVGIVSAGIGCALPKLPGLYTRVSFYLDWIERTIKLYDGQSLNTNSTEVVTDGQPTSTIGDVTSTTTKLPPTSSPSLTTTEVITESTSTSQTSSLSNEIVNTIL